MVIHTNVNGLLNLGHSDTHVHNIDAKRCKVDNDVQHICGTAV